MRDRHEALSPSQVALGTEIAKRSFASKSRLRKRYGTKIVLVQLMGSRASMRPFRPKYNLGRRSGEQDDLKPHAAAR
ncbi:MAG: hypothetical protein GWP06_14090 [Actinobacteria bacterium]|nr:hypothetical protein [Actinomycetota bacterium]